MKPETFFERFDLFADAPNAVEKIRELVLELAVTGRLVARDDRDEPASTLLKSTAAERAKLVAAKRIKGRPTEPVQAAEQPFDLPSSWAWARLLDVGYELGQKVPDKRFTYIDVGGIDSDKGRISDRVEKLEPGDAPSRARKLVARGTVIYSTVRPYLLNIAIVDQDFDPEPIASTAFGILHPFEGINNRYLFYWLRSAPFTAYVQAGMKGMAYPAINDEKFYSGYIALPPLAEQKRIVAKVDELMTLCDRLEAQQEERETRHAALARSSLARFADAPTPANLNLLFHPSYTIPPDDLRKCTLTLAVQGKLVPQDPNDMPASEMLSSNAKLPDGHVRRRKIMKRGPSASNAELFPRLPASWEYASVQTLYDLNMIVDYADGNHGSLYPRSTEFGDSGVTFVTARDIANGRVCWEKCARLNEDRAQQLTKGWARGGDVLLTHNATVGRVARVERDVGKFLLGTSATFYRLNEEFLDASYFYHMLCSPIWQGQLEAIMQQTTRNQVSIQKQAFFQVPVPSLAEQRRIVAKVDQLMALVDELETQLAASRATAEKLLEGIVAELATT